MSGRRRRPGSPPTSESQERIGRLCQAGLDVTGADGAAIGVISPADVLSLCWATNPVAGRLEQEQYQRGCGPSYDAVSTATVVESSPSPVGRHLALPLQLGGTPLGVLALHWLAVPSTPLTAAHRAAASLVADSAALALGARGRLRLGAHSDLPDREPTLQTPAEQAFHQATGMVMAQTGTDVATAVSFLRLRAARDRRPLGEVVADVVQRRLSFVQGDT